MTTADELIAVARQEIGQTETPKGSNKTHYAAMADHANGQPWCATFIVAMCRRVGIKLPSESAYTPTMANGFRQAGRFTKEPSKGAIAFFDFPDSKNRIQHVGIVTAWNGTSVVCVEGNTSAGYSGSQDNGGGVYERTRTLKHVVGFGRPTFTIQPAHTVTVTDFPGDAMKRHDLKITLGKAGTTEAGSGYNDIPGALAGNVIGVRYNCADPTGIGWDKTHIPAFGTRQQGSGIRVVAKGGPPGAVIDVSVWAAG